MTNETNEAAKYPTVRPEITAETIALDCQLADLILKCQGNARELDELAGMLDAHLGCCEEARDSLMGFNTEHPEPLDMTDLPADQQRLILESAVFGGLAMQTLQNLTDKDVAFLMERLSEGVKTITGKLNDKQVTESLQNYLEMHEQNTVKLVFYSSIHPADNN
ncbi:hypothetical protein D0A34_23695 [Microcoleus vaginatus PCC 9802]|uniref:hypothetical protein n=1 Tax=Microcoleus vaginatus TaxID=119532 RepID=UPI00020D3028|nr:hypothetical protein MicvaDRAFT_1746 [Microcoleus vaginatus FGP-2]UNU21450.1 hypothetical protein D0A34_23695 [Microcoleus vaginatus PCC 9802]